MKRSVFDAWPSALSCHTLFTVTQVCTSNSVGHVPSLPDLSLAPFMWAAGSEAATAQSAAVAQDCATIMNAENNTLEPSEADGSDVENVNGSEQVLLEDQLVVKVTSNGVDSGGEGGMASEAQVMLMSDVILWTPLHVKAASQQLQLKHVVSVVPIRSNPKAFTILATAPPPPPAGSSLIESTPAAAQSGWAIGLLKSYLISGNKNSNGGGSSSVTLEAASADTCARWSLAIKCLVAAVKRQQSQEEGVGGAAAHLFDESSISMQVHMPPTSWHVDVAASPSLHSACPACSLVLQQPPPPPSVSSWFLPSLTQKSTAVPAALARFCFYTGRWFCSSCHAEETAVLPGYAATFFDLQPRPVCRSAAALLQAVEERAVLTLPPSLILGNPSLSLLYLYRVQFKHFRCLHSTVPCGTPTLGL